MSRRGNSEGSIRKRPDGRWEARISVNGKQRSVYGTTRDEVARKMRAAQRATEQGIPLSNERITVKDFLQQWLEMAVTPSVRSSTYESYAGHVKIHLVPAIGKVPLAKLQPQHVQKLLNDLIASGLSANTVLRIRATLRRALNQAMKWGLVSRNVATLINPPKAAKYRVDPISPEEANAILNAVADHRLAPLYTALLGNGLRIGEGLGLSWRDVDFEAETLTVRQALQRINGESQLTALKSESSRRTLPMPIFVKTALVNQQAAQARDRLTAGTDWVESDLVFTTALGRPLDKSTAYHAFKRLLKAGGVRSMRVHDLRHGCATLLLARGVSPRVVMEILGHSQIGLTMNTYAHVLPTLQKDAARQMDAALSSGLGQLGSELGSNELSDDQVSEN